MSVRAVRFERNETPLAGELLLPPRAPRPCPGVVLLHGTGEGERAYYRVYAERFAEAGIASLIFDRRRHGDSDGSRSMDLFTLGHDAAAAWRVLADQPEIDGARVGLWGYSNGAWVASLAAKEVGDPAFLVLTGAAGVTPARAEAFRRARDLENQGIAPETLRAVERAWTLIFGYVATGAANDRPGDELRELAAVIGADAALERVAVPEFVRDRPELDSVPRFDRPPLNGSLEAIAGMSPDMAYDPIPVLMELACPTLVVLAENDASVAPVESLRRFELLAKARPGVRVEVPSGADHQFSAPGAPRWEPGTVRRADDFLPGYLDLMADWMASIARPDT